MINRRKSALAPSHKMNKTFGVEKKDILGINALAGCLLKGII